LPILVPSESTAVRPIICCTSFGLVMTQLPSL
jgi:hypothetical protein